MGTFTHIPLYRLDRGLMSAVYSFDYRQLRTVVMGYEVSESSHIQMTLNCWCENVY